MLTYFLRCMRRRNRVVSTPATKVDMNYLAKLGPFRAASEFGENISILKSNFDGAGPYIAKFGAC